MPRTTKNSSTPVLPKLQFGKNASESNPTTEAVSESWGEDFDRLSSEGKIISAKIDTFLEQLNRRDDQLEQLRRENQELKSKVQIIEQRLDHPETVNRSNNFVLSGSSLESISSDIPARGVIDLLRNKIQYELAQDNIISAYKLGSRSLAQSKESRKLMVKLRDGVKPDIVTACKRAKPAGLYANDDLTPLRANILYKLRQAKKKSNDMIVSCGSLNGQVFAYLRPPNPSAKAKKNSS